MEQKSDPRDASLDACDNEMRPNLNATNVTGSAETSGLVNGEVERLVSKKESICSSGGVNNDVKTLMNFTGKKRISIDGMQQHPKKKRQIRDKTVYKYGNYNRYYSYRVTKTMDEDPRLKLFLREWFEGKDCLDVGCNEGFITISIAQKYMCRNILGLDIDEGLIEKACKNLQAEALKSERFGVQLLGGGRPQDTRESREASDEAEGNQCMLKMDEERPCSTSTSLWDRVKFRTEHFIKDFPHGDYMKDGQFDTVLCLSITKWIHLNWGDQGGILVLEPQPWKSYQKKYKLSEVLRANYHSIVLRPLHFKEILLERIGFKAVQEVSRAVPDSCKGFDRSIFLYFK